MVEAEEKRRGWLGCVLKLFAAAFVVGILGCAGVISGGYFAFFSGIYAPPPVSDRALAIRGGTLFEGTDSAPREGVTVVIERGRITCAKRGCGIPVGATIIDAAGHAVLPGLTDLHLHFGAPVGDDMGQNPAGMIWDYMRHRPGVRRALQASGVTTIRSVGDDATNLPNTMTWLEEGVIGGPRLHAVGPIFTAPGGHPAGTIYKDFPHLIRSGTRQVDDAEVARAEVKAVLESGYTGIKLVYDDGGGRIPRLDKMVMQAVISEAVYNRAWVAAHTGTNAEIRDVVTAGATTVEHGALEPLAEDTIALMVKKETVYVPTLAVIEALRPDKLDIAKANAKAAFDGGVSIGVGSDTQGEKMGFGTSTHREIALLMEAGIPGTAALRGATGVASEALGLADDFGTLQAERRGDVIVVGKDPWVDAAALSEVLVVVQDGQIVFDAR
jgi:imidazolonepropionase-like amidohydrolase